ncbi:hypothetical protein LTR78_009977 [Recurvomyces mirabilis]|uniref:Uncharacterized protein n=1 Tax=Recurvomyces mirabilis TaxID=574656 RepID=A0AAE0TNL6_9PEZI|nr:hypothetical protein LTR78_009977 [Recurvomyces mirabilis]KAK5160318.1 hypothetical protein LTS14_001330 [Recurvomyces mirabilis]
MSRKQAIELRHATPGPDFYAHLQSRGNDPAFVARVEGMNEKAKAKGRREISAQEARKHAREVKRNLRLEKRKLVRSAPAHQTPALAVEKPSQPRQIASEFSFDRIREARGEEQVPDSQVQPFTMPEAADDYVGKLTGRENQHFQSMAALLQYRLHTNDKEGPGTMDAARAARFRKEVIAERRGGNARGLPSESLDFNAMLVRANLQEGLDKENVKKVTQAMQETTLRRKQE